MSSGRRSSHIETEFIDKVLKMTIENKTYPTQQYLREHYDYDPITGYFGIKYRYQKPKPFNKYHTTQINKVAYLTHVLIWIYLYGYVPTKVDHKNGIKSDNSKENLRDVTHKINCRNKKMLCTNTSGYTGVSFAKACGMWISSIAFDWRTIYLGQFNCPTSAWITRQKYLKDNPQLGFTKRHGTGTSQLKQEYTLIPLPNFNETIMHKITIIRSYLPKKPTYLYELRESLSGQITTQACYMGQLLLGKSITPLFQKKPIKLVSELGIAIYPFTRQCRGKMVQSDICTTIMCLPPSQESERKLAELLAPFSFKLTFQNTPNSVPETVWTSPFKEQECDFCGEVFSVCQCKEIDGEIVCDQK